MNVQKIVNFLNIQTVYGGLTSLANADLSIASLIFPLINNADFLPAENRLLITIAISAGIAAVPTFPLAFADTACHRSNSQYNDKDIRAKNAEPITASKAQEILLTLHHLFDIAESMPVWLILNAGLSYLGVYESTFTKIGIDTLLLFIAAAGTYQEKCNSRLAIEYLNGIRDLETKGLVEQVASVPMPLNDNRSQGTKCFC